MGRAPPVDFCNRNDPRPRLRDRPNPAHLARGRPRTKLFPEKLPCGRPAGCGWPRLSRDEPAEDSRVRGRRAMQCMGLDARRLSLRSLASRASPQPDRLEHLSSRNPWRRRLESPNRSAHSAPPRIRQASTARAMPAFRAASHVPPRRGAQSAAPEVPSTGRWPPRGLALPPQAVPNLWIVAGAFSIASPPGPFRHGPGERKLDGWARIGS